jgi:hypothetical protein
VQIIAHSALTFSMPRNRNWRKRLVCLICPNTGSDRRAGFPPQTAKRWPGFRHNPRNQNPLRRNSSEAGLG